MTEEQQAQITDAVTRIAELWERAGEALIAAFNRMVAVIRAAIDAWMPWLLKVREYVRTNHIPYRVSTALLTKPLPAWHYRPHNKVLLN